MAQKTPGVYIEEISKFPPSVAEVETAIPAFVGYTEKADYHGENLHNVPTRIMSLLEYEVRFGGPQTDFKNGSSDGVTVNLDSTTKAVNAVVIDKRFYMYEALRLFFDNGGGKCYIVSVGTYADAVASGDESKTDDSAPGLRVGLKRLEKYDEPTMIVFPDAVSLDEAELFTLQQLALAQCAKLQDRVGVFDLPELAGWDKAVGDFRDNIGINNLKYGAAYTPWLRSSYARDIDYGLFATNVRQGDASGATSNPKVDLDKLSTDSATNDLVKVANQAVTDVKTMATAMAALRGSFPTPRDAYVDAKMAIAKATSDNDRKAKFKALLAVLRHEIQALGGIWDTVFAGSPLRKDLEAYGTSTLGPAVQGIIAVEKNTVVETVSDIANPGAVAGEYSHAEGHGWLKQADGSDATVNDVVAATILPQAGDPITDKVNAALAALDPFVLGPTKSLLAFVDQMVSAGDMRKKIAQDALYDRHPIVAAIVQQIKKKLSEVPPSGAVAGVYCAVDNSRGVWKAPANVSLTGVLEPMVPIDFFEQEDLNIDVTGGKSINAIRTFTGLGTLVWGARTLAGNDNEWRYVPVRRFFNMVEESVKKSTAWAVFEPNDVTLWTKVKGMIENYLIAKWRDGALQGSTPDKAFYVKIGLGQTMTAQDVLEGRLIVEIGMAVVRPAEFIVLRFSHKLPEA